MDVLTAANAWPEILECIRKRVSPQQFATWFRNLKAQSFTPEELNIRVPNIFFKEWLAQNYLGVIEESVAEVGGCRPKIVFTLDPSASDRRRRRTAGDSPAGRPAAPKPIGLRLNEHYTFDTFVVGPSNQLAHAAALAVCQVAGARRTTRCSSTARSASESPTCSRRSATRACRTTPRSASRTSPARPSSTSSSPPSSATTCPPSACDTASSSSCSLTTSSSSRAPSGARRNSSTRSTTSTTRRSRSWFRAISRRRKSPACRSG